LGKAEEVSFVKEKKSPLDKKPSDGQHSSPNIGVICAIGGN